MMKQVIAYIEKYHMITPGDTIAVGVSGGADSVCLLFVLMEIRKRVPFTMEVVHVNHGIREEAAADAAYVEQLCKENGLPFHLVNEDVRAAARDWGISEEEAGRKIRYQAFNQVLEDKAVSGKIAVAHNSNDRAETMLFHLFRGTGLRGASGIRPVNGAIIRPLLCVERKEIEAWLHKKGIPYCQDLTNREDKYTRNRIRHHILPYAEQEICRGAVAHMNAACENLEQAEDFIERLTRVAMQECVKWNDDNNSALISVPLYQNQDVYLRGRMLLSCIHILTDGGKDITGRHIKNIEELLTGQSNGSRELHLPYGLKVYRNYDSCIFTKTIHINGNNLLKQEYPVQIPGSMKVPGLGSVSFTLIPYKKSEIIPNKKYTKWLDYDRITKSVVFRTRTKGDYLSITEAMHHKSLQDYFVNQKINKSERETIYILAEGSHVIWVPGYRISEFYKVKEDTQTVLQIEAADR